MKALVAHELNRLGVEEIHLDPPRTEEVQVRMVAAGVCHSDLSALDGTIPHPFPFVLGHEGAGIVEAVGEGVTHVAPGDPVVMSFVPNCGRCFHCLRNEAFLCRSTPAEGRMVDGTSRLRRNGDEELGAFLSLGLLAEQAVVPAMNVLRLPDGVPFESAALIGCGVTTGVGAVFNTARVEPGATVAVFGCGGVGIAAIQGARIAGASRIFAIDVSREKLELARTFGADDTLLADDAISGIFEATEGIGVDYTFEATGKATVVEAALKTVRRGGTAVAVGIGKLSETIEINAFKFPLSGRRLSACVFGSANPREDFPRLLALYRSGRLDLDGMVTATYSIDEAPRAFDDMKDGANARGVVRFD